VVLAFLPPTFLKELVGAKADLLFHAMLSPLELTRLGLDASRRLNDRSGLGF
jgi:hypothetical protein